MRKIATFCFLVRSIYYKLWLITITLALFPFRLGALLGGVGATTGFCLCESEATVSGCWPRRLYHRTWCY